MLYAVFYNNNLIGLFNDYNKMKIATDGLVQNKFITNNKLVIKSFYKNSFTKCEYKEIEKNTNSDIKDNKNTKEIIDMKQKSELEYELNELKKKKAKIEESKNVYNVDLELFNKFKKLKLDNNDFIIPEMFMDKYDLMFELEKENNLTWENFHELYKHKQVETSFSKLFN